MFDPNYLRAEPPSADRSATGLGASDPLVGGPVSEPFGERTGGEQGDSCTGGTVPQPRLERVDRPHRFEPDFPYAAANGPAETAQPESWLRLHAEELIERLQQWAAELDAREAQLNAAAASQDQRERQLRVRHSELVAEWSEQQRTLELPHQQQPEH